MPWPSSSVALPWRAPSWWDIGSNVDDPSNRRLIKNAYAKAETCGQCRNFSWPPEGVILEFLVLKASAQGGCAGCIVLCGIMSLLQYHVGDDRHFFPKRFIRKQSRILVESRFHFGYEVYSPHIHDHVWRIPHLPRELQVSPYSGSAHVIKRAQMWLRECEETHESCKHTTSFLPSRVLLIQGPQNVTLFESNGETAPYACLSHCWGKKHIIRTTTSNLPHHKQSISWKRLPLTFQHAVSFTYRLGLKYLWIDSLCIIQDDIEDWRREGSKMAQIYSGAYITLAATASRNASGGLFRHTPDRPLFRLTYPDGKGSRSELCIRPPVKNLRWYLANAPLLSRAWALQERLLSPRILHFTHAEVIWECRTEDDCECSMRRLDSLEDVCNPSSLNHAFSIAKYRCEPYVWWHVVEQYSQQRLTYEKDVFPALQGVSKMFSDYKKCRYLAGLWETSLITDLLWIHDSEKAGLKEWRAPSWSWASVFGRVRWGLRSDSTYFSPLATCTAAQIEPAGTDEFGELLSASITLRARCLPQAAQEPWLQFAYGPRRSSDRHLAKHPTWNGLNVKIVVNPDIRPHTLQALGPEMCFKTVVLLQDYSHRTDRSKYKCLVLKKCDGNDNTYERVAFVEVSVDGRVDTSMFELDEEETLCIV